jgi:hypothetical protein
VSTMPSPAEPAGVIGSAAMPASPAASAEATASPPLGPAPRRGWLRHGNTPGDPDSAPRCGARTRAGTPCRAPAMKNGRCRMHGGASTGARTAVGRALCGHARRKHPAWLAAGPSERSAARRTTRITRTMTRYARAWPNPWRRSLALLVLLRSIGRLLPARIEECSEAATLFTMPYVRGEVDDMLRWLGKERLAADERPDSARVIAVLDGAVEVFGIADGIDAPRRRRERRRLAQRARRAARAAQRAAGEAFPARWRRSTPCTASGSPWSDRRLPAGIVARSRRHREPVGQVGALPRPRRRSDRREALSGRPRRSTSCTASALDDAGFSRRGALAASPASRGQQREPAAHVVALEHRHPLAPAAGRHPSRRTLPPPPHWRRRWLRARGSRSASGRARLLA